jgi:DNA polymerase-3 subunit epsilon
MSDEPREATPVSASAATPRPVPTLAELGPRFTTLVESLERPIVFLDIEATGIDPFTDRIIEISMVRVGPMPMGVEAPVTLRIDPKVRIPIEASEIHGIVNDDLADAPSFSEAAPRIVEVLQGADLAGFAVGRFDVRILAQEFVRAGVECDLSKSRVIDAQVIFHQREPRHLTAALKFYRDKDLVDAHGAEADAIASLEVFAGQLSHYPDLPLAVDGLEDASSQRSDSYCDTHRRFQWRDNEPVFNFGRLRGTPLRWVAGDPEERKYLKWFLEGSFEEDAKSIVRDALGGVIRRRPERASASASSSGGATDET